MSDAAKFRRNVLRCIRSIPSGSVASYGQIARVAGFPNHSRHVGHVLRGLADDEIDWDLHREVEARQERRAARERAETRTEAREEGNASGEARQDGDTDAPAEGTGDTAQDRRSASPAPTEGRRRRRRRDREANARAVPADLDNGPVPWHRVINHKGRVSIRFPRASMDLQAAILRREGVDVYQDAWNQWTVSMRQYGWDAEHGTVELVE
ncbi:hypothetical protein DFJ74DRAFT_446309 [Hyaloraphidium curvatum]|nr:hypothetical protein DFJ74DRAFT_446309 [Hyaloraphidium curvatum]